MEIHNGYIINNNHINYMNVISSNEKWYNDNIFDSLS